MKWGEKDSVSLLSRIWTQGIEADSDAALDVKSLYLENNDLMIENGQNLKGRYDIEDSLLLKGRRQ